MAENKPTSWFEETWPRLVVASGIGYVAMAYAISRWLTRPSPAVVEVPRDLAGVSIEKLAVQAVDDGTNLSGWHFEPARPRATVVLFHGMRANRSDLVERIAFLTAAGYRCIAFDFRAHGESGGQSCSFGYHEKHDVAAILQFVRGRWPAEPLGAVAVSMGAAALCFAGETARGFDAIVLESVYVELTRAFDQRVGTVYPGWLRHFRRGIVWMTERRLGARIADVAPLAHVAQLAPRPVLLLTGSEDQQAPAEEMRLLADKLAGTSQFHQIAGAGHEDVCSSGGRAYQDLLLSFLERHLFQGRTPLAA